MRRAKNRPGAKKLLKKLLSELEALNHEQRLEWDRMIFNRLNEADVVMAMLPDGVEDQFLERQIADWDSNLSGT